MNNQLGGNLEEKKTGDTSILWVAVVMIAVLTLVYAIGAPTPDPEVLENPFQVNEDLDGDGLSNQTEVHLGTFLKWLTPMETVLVMRLKPWCSSLILSIVTATEMVSAMELR